MSGGGGKSGSESVETSLPEWLRGPAERNLGRAEDVQRLGYMPYRGPEVAAFDPNQIAAFQNNNDAARAFGFNAPTNAVGGMPQATTYEGGIQGYDSNAIYDQALLDTQAYQPETFDQYNALFGANVGTTANPGGLPTGRPSGGGGGGGGIDPNAVMLQKLRDDRANAGNTPTPMQNYLDDSQMSFSDPRKSPGHPSNFNYTPIADDADDVATASTTMNQTYNTSGSGSNPFGYRDTPYQNRNLGAMDIHSGSRLEQNLSNPIDQIMADYQAGK
tara:strand:+ start:419 stop:1240 length:822 start_codon:yes stop_codon:yes gene_type:complete